MAWVDADLLRVSNRVEWPALLHNICMLHSVVRLRARYQLSGFNRPEDFAVIGTAELWVSYVGETTYLPSFRIGLVVWF